MYTKLANSILTSTVWMENDQTRLVWLTLLAMVDKNGEVQASVPGLANVARVSVEACREAIETFLSPDPDSRTKDDEGRRLEVIDGGWFVINHEKYRQLASDEDRRRKAAERQKRFRDRKRNATVTPTLPQITHTDTHTDSNVPAGAGVDKSTLSPPYSQVVDEFNKAFRLKCRMTNKRKAALKARWRDQWWRDNWQAALEHGSRSEFLSGNNERGWTIDLEFFLRPDSATSILEGKYDNKDRNPTNGTPTIWPEVFAFVVKMPLTAGYMETLTDKFGSKVAGAVKSIGVQAIKDGNEFQQTQISKRFKELVG